MHSPEPWKLAEEHESMCQIVDADGKIVAVTRGCSGGLQLPDITDRRPHDIAERIVACVNACRGVPTQALTDPLRPNMGHGHALFAKILSAAGWLVIGPDEPGEQAAHRHLRASRLP